MMACQNCHTGDEMHGMTGQFNHRYDGPERTLLAHRKDATRLSGRVTASHNTPDTTSMRSVARCATPCRTRMLRLSRPEIGGGRPLLQDRTIGNDVQDRTEPDPECGASLQYVPVRHVPIARDSFAYYGENLLPNFDSRPTWTYATPHTIQRITPQNETCNACHGHAELFLTRDDVDPGELEANRSVIVEDIP